MYFIKHLKKETIISYALIGVGCGALILFISLLSACETFIEIDPPKDQLISETVFEEVTTVESAFANIYVKLRQEGLISGYSGLSTSLGIYADELDYFGLTPDLLKQYNHNVLPSDGLVSKWWRHAYNIIYAANSIIEGLENSKSLVDLDKNRFMGQALFIRGYVHSVLVNLYGEVPYVVTTDYEVNNQVYKDSIEVIYDLILTDLLKAEVLISQGDYGDDNFLPSKDVVYALLARLYLYQENWGMAEKYSTKLIDIYELESIEKVFLNDSKETIWQLKLGSNPVNTYEALQLIITSLPTRGMALTSSLLSAIEAGDQRFSHWVGSIESNDGFSTLYFAHKYKATQNTTMMSEESPIIFRLAEQYLIRAEARVNQDNFVGAKSDINAIRNRAELVDIEYNTKPELLDAILQERRIELFTEQGHRWFDLKRLNEASDVLSVMKPGWEDTDVVFPIPESELNLNSNLKPQNSGY